MSKNNDLKYCRDQINKMLSRSQTKIIFPILTFGLLKSYQENKRKVFTDVEIRESYKKAVIYLKKYLRHNFHIGGKYYDAYPSRNLPKYNVLKVLGAGKYQLQDSYIKQASDLIPWIPHKIKEYISNKLSIIPELSKRKVRIKVSEQIDEFKRFLQQNMDSNPVNFEIFSFAIIKVHLEKFACKIYRDTRRIASQLM